MSKTQRLFDLIQILRRYRYPVNGRQLAEELGISLRTLYRDIATLQAQGNWGFGSWFTMGGSQNGQKVCVR